MPSARCVRRRSVTEAVDAHSKNLKLAHRRLGLGLAKQLVASRDAAGLSTAQLALRMGVETREVVQIEASLKSGQCSLTLATLIDYCYACGTGVLPMPLVISGHPPLMTLISK